MYVIYFLGGIRMQLEAAILERSEKDQHPDALPSEPRAIGPGCPQASHLHAREHTRIVSAILMSEGVIQACSWRKVLKKARFLLGHTF